jgi:hypothetical protein
MSDDLIHVDRRTTLKWLAAALAFSSHHGKSLAGTYMPSPKGYGTDPNLNQVAPIGWDKLMSAHELKQTALLADLFLPATASSPAPSALGIHDFIDEWISAPYDEQMSDRPIIKDGLSWLDQETTKRFGKDFTAVTDAQRAEMMKMMAAKPDFVFFKRLRNLVVAAYFSSDAGFKDIGYSGNVTLAAFPAPTDEMMEIIDSECKKLGV